MARARNIKPSFFTNDELGELDPLARLLFIGMWTVADFKGCLEYRPKKMKVELLPYDNCDMEALVTNLDKSGFITIYNVDDQDYIKINNFTKHQHPHPNERKKGSDVPDVPDVSKNTPQATDSKEVIASNDKDITNQDKNGTDRADSLHSDSLHSDSLHSDSLSADSLSPDSRPTRNTHEKFSMTTDWLPDPNTWPDNAKLMGLSAKQSEGSEFLAHLAAFRLHFVGGKHETEGAWQQKLKSWIKRDYEKTKPGGPRSKFDRSPEDEAALEEWINGGDTQRGETIDGELSDD